MKMGWEFIERDQRTLREAMNGRRGRSAHHEPNGVDVIAIIGVVGL